MTFRLRRHVLLLCAAHCFAAYQAMAANRNEPSIPRAPELGNAIEAPLPPIGDTTGVGKATGALPPAKIERTVRSARADRNDVLRGKKRRSPLEKLGRSVVLVVTPTKLGSATLIDQQGLFVTSWHIVKDVRELGVIYMPAQRDKRVVEADAIQATVEQTNPTADLAIIRVTNVDKSVKPVALANPEKAQFGAPLRIVSHPYGEIWTLSDGTLKTIIPAFNWKGLDGSKHQADVVHFQTTSITGNAGGPVLDKNDNLLAVDTLRSDDKNLVNLGVSVGEVHKLLTAPRAAALISPAKPEASKQCHPQRLSTRRTKANDGTVFTLDLNCNGKSDAMLLVPDDRKLANHLASDSDENGGTDAVYFDFDRDGKFDEVRFDTNEDGRADLLGTELDSRLIPRTTRVLDK